MEPSNSFLLPKLRVVDGIKTKTKSSHINLIESTEKIADSLPRNKKLSDFSSEENKQSRSKSSSFVLSQAKLQYKYVNKSPQYFKKKQRSMQTLSPTHVQDNMAMEQMIQHKMKRFNKDSLINLAKEGLYKNINYKHRIIPRKRNPPPLYAESSQHNGSNETKYSSFNPAKIMPMVHSLQKVFPSALISR